MTHGRRPSVPRTHRRRSMEGQSPILEVDSSMSGVTVSAALDRALATGPVPRSITVVGQNPSHGAAASAVLGGFRRFQSRGNGRSDRRLLPRDSHWPSGGRGAIGCRICDSRHLCTGVDDLARCCVLFVNAPAADGGVDHGQRSRRLEALATERTNRRERAHETAASCARSSGGHGVADAPPIPSLKSHRSDMSADAT